jgi:SpoIID/LytB domain protein
LHYNKIAKAVDEVLPYIMMYEDEPIIAAFHSMSSGKTESAENMWGTAVDYLVPVNSKSDKDAPDYADECEISAEFVRARLEKVIDGIQLGDNPENWIKTGEKSPSGTVLEVTVGDKKVTGNDIRQAFGLRSADFSVEFDGENAVVNITSKTFSPFVIVNSTPKTAEATSVEVTKDTDANTCTVKYAITSTDLAKTPTLYIAFYTEQNKLITVSIVDEDIISSDEITVSIPSGSKKCKVMLAEMTLAPLCAADDCEI